MGRAVDGDGLAVDVLAEHGAVVVVDEHGGLIVVVLLALVASGIRVGIPPDDAVVVGSAHGRKSSMVVVVGVVDVLVVVPVLLGAVVWLCRLGIDVHVVLGMGGVGDLGLVELLEEGAARAGVDDMALLEGHGIVAGLVCEDIAEGIEVEGGLVVGRVVVWLHVLEGVGGDGGARRRCARRGRVRVRSIVEEGGLHTVNDEQGPGAGTSTDLWNNNIRAS